MKKYDVSILGAGLVGSLLSILLSKRGYKVGLFEKRPDMRREDISGGRSINLALSNRGLSALYRAGLELEIEDMVIPMHGRMMHDVNGGLSFQPYGKEGQYINSISRGGLNKLLMDKAEENGVEIFFESNITEVDLKNNTIKSVINENPDVVNSEIIAGADGAFSILRGSMMKSDRFNYSQTYLTHGYKELSIRPNEDGGFKMEKNYLHIWPRGSYMLIALPNTDGSFTCTLFLAFEGDPSFEQLKSNGDIEAFFQKQFPDAKELMPHLIEEFNENPTSSLATVRCYPWVKDNAFLIGDSCHAVVPFYGQGMNCGFEDCRVLEDMLDLYKDDWGKALNEYQQQRKPDADAIADLALRNFIEMRDLVGDDTFLLRKKIEARIHKEHPEDWIPLYSMVTFNENIRYSDALRLGKIQDKIMEEVMKIENIGDTWDSIALEPIIEKYQKEIAG